MLTGGADGRMALCLRFANHPDGCCDWDDDDNDDDVAAQHTYVEGWASLLSSSSELESSMTLLESQVGLVLWALTLDLSQHISPGPITALIKDWLPVTIQLKSFRAYLGNTISFIGLNQLRFHPFPFSCSTP